MAAVLGAPAAHSPTPDITMAGRKRSRSEPRIGNGAGQSLDANSRQPTVEDLHMDQHIMRDQMYSMAAQKYTARQHIMLQELNEDVKWFKDFRANTKLDPGRIHGEGFAGYGNGWTSRYPSALIYPRMRKRPGNRKTPEMPLNRRDRAVQSDQFEELAPIRLEIEFEKLRLRDTFTWNVYDRTTNPSIFAAGLVEDLQIPKEATNTFVQLVNQSMQEQIIDHHPHPWIEEEPLDPHLPYSAYKNDEIRITIKLNITIGVHTLVDQFEWDINNRLNSPEEFAARMARDLSLSGEFMTAIAHQIHEQTQMFTKSLYVTGHPFDGRPLEDPDVKENVLQSPLPSVFRSYQSSKDYAPWFFELNAAELEKADSALSREQRQLKRSVNRRGGPALPDLKDRFLQTVRTQVISTVIPGAADSVQTSGVYKPARAASGRGRRPGWKTVGDDESDMSEGEESEPDSPVRQVNQGTARTRGVRGAATAAQAAMRAGFVGSLTPDTEARVSNRRFGRFGDEREESIAEPTLILRLKLPRERFRQWWRDYKAARQAGRQLPYPGGPLRGVTPYNGMPPPSTPGVGNRPLGSGYVSGVLTRPSSSAPSPAMHNRQTSRERSMAGSPPASGPQTPAAHGAAGPIPSWLVNASSSLRKDYPNDSFEPLMIWNNPQQDWIPRFRCHDCPGMTYKTEAPPADPRKNFRTHLENRKHRQQVEQRLMSGASAQP